MEEAAVEEGPWLWWWWEGLEWQGQEGGWENWTVRRREAARVALCDDCQFGVFF